jgi:hypothetical protein
MSKDEALDLALEALESCGAGHITDGGNQWHDEKLVDKAITAIKQAQALDKMAENARELGLDYEPVLKDNSNYRYDPPVAEPDLIARLKHPEQHYEFIDPKKANAVLMSLCQEAADALAAPVQEPVRWSDYEPDGRRYPVVPDAMTSADIQENIEYVAGWNECRQAMLEMMK